LDPPLRVLNIVVHSLGYIKADNNIGSLLLSLKIFWETILICHIIRNSSSAGLTFKVLVAAPNMSSTCTQLYYFIYNSGNYNKVLPFSFASADKTLPTTTNKQLLGQERLWNIALFNYINYVAMEYTGRIPSSYTVHQLFPFIVSQL
jgi:hypothetical protein